MNDQSNTPQLTRELARYAVGASYTALPNVVRGELVRTFLNWIGCVLGGCSEPAARIAAATAQEAGGHPQSTMIGYGQKIDAGQASFINCISSSILAFDDTHLATVTHPTGPVAAALLAWAERSPVAGEDFLAALAVGIEIQCRLGNMLIRPPSPFSLGFFITGITGPIGAAAALGKLLKFDEQQMYWAIGLAATQAAGLRVTHGSMAAAFVPAHGARIAISAAMLAARGFTCSDVSLEGPKGFVEVLAPGADLRHALDGLGTQFELLANAYKPYPCGIVIHPALDACLDIAAQMPEDARIASVQLSVHPLALGLTGRRNPIDPLEAQISLFHWTAAALLRKRAGLAEVRQACIDDPAVVALRARIDATADATLGRDAARAEVVLDSGQVFSADVAHARGSLDRPMTDAELDSKFLSQANLVLNDAQARSLLALCRDLPGLADVGCSLSSILSSASVQDA